MKGAFHEPVDPLETLELKRCCEIMGPPNGEDLERGLDGFLARIGTSLPAERVHALLYGLASSAKVIRGGFA